MADQTFKVGDVVWHKSGGPKMGVTAVGRGNSGPYVSCQYWHSDKKYFAESDFNPELLTSEDPGNEAPAAFA